MNKKKSIWVRISVGMMIVGLICTVLGVALGGSQLSNQFNFNTHYVYSDGDTEPFGLSYDRSQADVFEVITDLDIKVEFVELHIKTGKEYKVEAFLQSKDHYSINYEAGKVSIHQTRDKNRSKRENNKETTFIQVTLPPTHQLTSLNLNLNLGVGNIEQVKATNLNAIMNMGSLKVDQLVSGNATLVVTMGELNLQGDVTNNLKLTANMSQNTINLTSPEVLYGITHRVNMGTIQVGSQQRMGFIETAHHDLDRQRMIEAEVSMGAVEINFDQPTNSLTN